MNRTIKFRGKRIDNVEWVYGYYMHEPSSLMPHVIYTLEKAFVEVNPNTVGQFIGLLDKNGKQIYEGDICSFDMMDRTGFVGQVKYSDNGIGYWFDLVKGAATLNAISNIEVIGNIHENPDLLK